MKNLKTGMLVECRDGSAKLILGNTVISADNGGLGLKEFYRDDLTCTYREGDDVMKVYGIPYDGVDDYIGAGLDTLLTKHYKDSEICELLWERQEFQYPMWFKSRGCDTVVRFTALNFGEVVAGKSRKLGLEFTPIPHTDTNVWVQVDEPIQEMTMADICKALGKNIKIVKE